MYAIFTLLLKCWGRDSKIGSRKHSVGSREISEYKNVFYTVEIFPIFKLDYFHQTEKRVLYENKSFYYYLVCGI